MGELISDPLKKQRKANSYPGIDMELTHESLNLFPLK
jgi:hypothetical protein